MTTILCDAKKGIMLADSSISDDDRIWLDRKVYRVKGNLVGFAGDYEEGRIFLDWLRGKRDKPKCKDISALMLTHEGLFIFEGAQMEPRKVERGIESIGTGAKAVICTYEALGFDDPKKAMKIVCKHDAGSRPPIRTYKL